MTRQTSEPIESARLSATNRTARELARLVMDGSLTLDAPYQRGAVWTPDQQIALVRSWLMGVPIPAVIINNRMSYHWRDANPTYSAVDDPQYAAIDGKQRLLAAAAWFSGDLAVPASWFGRETIAATVDTEDGPYARHTDLTRAEQTHEAFTWQLPMAEAQLATVSEEAAIYLLVNGGGTPQTDADMDNAARVAETG